MNAEPRPRALVEPAASLALYTMLSDEGPLSTRLNIACDQLGAMFDADELKPLPRDTRTVLHGLRMFLLSAGQEAFELERVRERRTRRMPEWLRHWGRI